MSSALSWLPWGSTGPITNLGYHDFFGSGFVYVFAGAMALVFVRRLGQRPGFYRPHREAARVPLLQPRARRRRRGPHLRRAPDGDPVLRLLLRRREALFVSVTMADTSIGIAFNNLGLAWAGGAITGAIIAYRTKNYIYTLLGPFAGYVSGAPAFDVYEPWEMFLVALVAPLVAYAVYEWTQRREIDEHKLIPLFLGVGVVRDPRPSASSSGGRARRRLLRHRVRRLRVPAAEVNLLWQAVGLAVGHRRGARDRHGPVLRARADDRPQSLRGDHGRGLRPPLLGHRPRPALQTAALATGNGDGALAPTDGEPATTDVRTEPPKV